MATPSSTSKLKDVMNKVHDIIDEKGLEAYPFKIKWYNHRVTTHFQLPYHEDTLAILLVSKPSMFEQLLYPFILSYYRSHDVNIDPIDKCLKDEIFTKITLKLHEQGHETCYIQDYEIGPNRRPKILLQTAGHVSGSAYYYQRSDVPQSPWATSTNIYGVSVHPKYGGWFAFRGVIICQNIILEEDELLFKEPPKCLTDEKQIIELLEKFNLSWQDWSYRDVLDGTVEERYSEKQKEYFATLPKDRHLLVKKWIEENDKQTK